MNNFERLMPYMHAVIASAGLSEEAVKDIDAFRGEAAYLDLPRSPREALVTGDHALFLLRLSADTLTHLAHQDLSAALGTARKVLELPLIPEPFEGTFELLAARIANLIGDHEAQALFRGRYREYVDRFAASRALLGLSEALLDPYMAGVLEEALEEATPTSRVEDSEPVLERPYSTFSVPESAYQPFWSKEASTRTYFVLVHKLIDPRVAEFTILKATLADITDGDDYGRIDEHGMLYADLVLDFDEDPHEMLDALNLENLAIRLVFKHADTFEAFSTSGGTLFDVEASVEEKRLYFKLRVPPAWVAAQVPLHAIWSSLESCVLISES